MRPFLAVWLLSLSFSPNVFASEVSEWDAEPQLDAFQLVTPALLHGPDYQVEPTAQVIGYHARFTIRTPWGEIPAESVEMLGLRISEIPAIRALHEASVTKTLADAGIDVVKNTATAFSRVVTNPVDSITGIPRGVGRYFLRRWQKIDDRLTRLGDRFHRQIAEDGDPYSSAEGPLSATRITDKAHESWYDKPTKEITRLVKSELSYGRARRELARELSIDPATSNPLIRPRLDALAWVAVSGSQAGNFAMGGLGAGASEVIKQGSLIDEVVWSLDPDDLRKRNDDHLSGWCNDELQRRRFLRHGSFTPVLQTALVDVINDLALDQGCEALIDIALMTRSEIEARYLINALRLSKAYLNNPNAKPKVIPVGATLLLQSQDNELIIPLAVDYLSWTPEIQTFFDESGIPVGNRTLLVSGSISLRAQRELTQRGYSLVAHMPYEGSPPYAASPTQ